MTSSAQTQPLVELLYFAGCANAVPALRRLKSALAGEGFRPRIKLTKVRDQSEADRLHFAGSPTVRINGRDVDPLKPGGFGLYCRLYRDGETLSGIPPAASIRALLVRHRDALQNG
jgi:hypothetical protein